MEEHGIVIYKLGSLNMKFFGYEDCSQVRQSHMHQLILLGCMYGVQVPVWWYGSFPLGVIPYLLRGYPMLCIAAVSQQQCRLICSLFCLSEPWRKPRAESPVGLHHICIASYHFCVR